MTALLSLIRTIIFVISLKLEFPKKYCRKDVIMEDGLKFTIFRHMKLKRKKQPAAGSIFIVRFKFKKFSHATNIKMSRIPIPLIAGFPGFSDKIWMIDWETGYWQGMYQWDTVDAVEKYKKSFVLGIMNKRSIEATLSYRMLPDTDIDDYLKKIIIT